MSDNTLKMISDHDVKWVDLRFTDPRGKEQHTTVPAKVGVSMAVLNVCQPYRPLNPPFSTIHHCCEALIGFRYGRRDSAAGNPSSNAAPLIKFRERRRQTKEAAIQPAATKNAL